MENTKMNITVYGKEVTAKNGNKFPVFSTKINDEYFKVAFTRDCLNAPRSQGVYDLEVDMKNINESKSSYISDKTGKRGASTLWIKHVDTYHKRTEEELERENLEKNMARFGKSMEKNLESVNTEEPLPF